MKKMENIRKASRIYPQYPLSKITTSHHSVASNAPPQRRKRSSATEIAAELFEVDAESSPFIIKMAHDKYRIALNRAMLTFVDKKLESFYRKELLKGILLRNRFVLILEIVFGVVVLFSSDQYEMLEMFWPVIFLVILGLVFLVASFMIQSNHRFLWMLNHFVAFQFFVGGFASVAYANGNAQISRMLTGFIQGCSINTSSMVSMTNFDTKIFDTIIQLGEEKRFLVELVFFYFIFAIITLSFCYPGLRTFLFLLSINSTILILNVVENSVAMNEVLSSGLSGLKPRPVPIGPAVRQAIMLLIASFVVAWQKERASRKLFWIRTLQSTRLRSQSVTIRLQNKEKERLEERLASTKLKARLNSRPPVAFTVEEFAKEASNGTAEQELTDMVVAICADWVFVSPISDEKWAFFLSYIVPIPFWEKPANFAKLQDIAHGARAPLMAHIARILRDMACPGTEHGPWLLKQLDHINSKQCIADLAPSWIDSNFLAIAHTLVTTDAKKEFEVNVLPASVRALSNMLFAPLKSELLALSQRIVDEVDAAGNDRRYSYSGLTVQDAGGDRSIILRCTRKKGVKGLKRMSVKVAESQAKGVPFPAISNIGDALRASFVVQTSEDVRECWRCISKNFEVLRLKNKFKDAFEELSSSGDIRTLSPNLHINCLYKYFIDGVEARIVVEFQVYVKAFLEIKRESHKIYAVTRAGSIEALL